MQLTVKYKQLLILPVLVAGARSALVSSFLISSPTFRVFRSRFSARA
jgi:hypothetical protein